jgi:hypothetical protein
VRGEIYLYSDHGVKRHPLSVHTIVNYSPLIPDPGEGILYLGHKTTTLWVIEPRTGRITQCFNAERGWKTECRNERDSASLNVDEDTQQWHQPADEHSHNSTITSTPPPSLPSRLYFARIDYFVAAIDLLSGVQKYVLFFLSLFTSVSHRPLKRTKCKSLCLTLL